MSIPDYADSRGVARPTVYEAVKAGHIAMPLDAEITDAGWLAEHNARRARVKATEESRERQFTASGISFMAEIAELRRVVAELQASTCRRVDAEAAHGRRVARLQAALEAWPLSYCAEAAAALQRPPGAVYAVLQKFARELRAEAGPAETPRLAAE